MEKSVATILRNRKVDTTYFSHVSLFGPKGKYEKVRGKHQFSRQQLDEFWDVYCDLLYKNPNAILGVAENPQNYIPVVVDIDIRKEFEGEKKLYENEHIRELVQIYQSILRNILDICTDKHLVCLVLEKESYIVEKGKNKYIKNGFHLHFPYIFLSKVEHEVQLLPRVKETVKELEVFKDLGFEDSSKLIDEAYTRIPWMTYSSRKQINMQPYQITRVLGAEAREIELEEALGDYVIYDHRENRIEFTKEKPIQYYLPRILSILPFNRPISELKPGLDYIRKGRPDKNNNSGGKKSYKEISIMQSLKVATKLLPLLSDFRAEDRNEWMTIGWALYNIGDGCEEAFDLWLEFSRRCPEKFNESECKYTWDRMVKKDITLGTLRYFASIDNPVAYSVFKSEMSEKYIKESLNGSHNDIAKALYEEYNTEFVCASISAKLWYHFVNHRWKVVDGGYSLRMKISGEIKQRYADMGAESFQQVGRTDDDAQKAMYNARIDQCKKMVKCLGQAPFKNNVMRENMEVFYNEEFLKKLNMNKYLIGFNNGVYDLKKNLFRSGRPEDYISKRMPVDYKEFNENDPKMFEIHDFLQKIFPDENIRKYFLDTTCEIFVGGNADKKVFFWSGEAGHNGKSITVELMEKMLGLGEYVVKLPTTFLTGKRVASGAACSDLVRAGNGVRWIVMQEPNNKEEINIGTLKELSGNDTVYARALYKEGGEIIPFFTPAIICNNPPKLPYGGDSATWKRIRVIPFESIFEPEKAPDTWEEQFRLKIFPMDTKFSDKIPGMIQAFAWFLLNHRKNKVDSPEPDKVKLATAVYRRTNDVYRQFIEESITEDQNCRISLAELYTAFKDWFRESQPNHRIPVKNDVKIYFVKLWGEPGKGCKWDGYRISTLDDDNDMVILEKDDLRDYSVSLS